MIICKYSKLDTAAYVPHLDLLRAVGMAIRRTGLHVAFSEGFNPHARLFFSQPMPLGALSEAEYFCADSISSADVFMQRLNESLPNGVKILKCANVQSNPNPAALTVSADYEVRLLNPLPLGVSFEKINDEKSVIISYEAKGKQVEKDVRANLFKVSNTSDIILLNVSCGNINLRADRVTEHLLRLAAHTSRYIVKKTAAYDKNGDNLDKIFFKE